MKSLKFGRFITNAIVYLILIVMSFLWLVPIAWIVLQSFAKGGLEVAKQIIPNEFTMDNYIHLFCNFTGKGVGGSHDGLFFTWFCNTLVVAILTCIISTVFVLCTAYALSRFRFKARGLFMKVNLIIGMFPGFLGLIIMYWVMKEIFSYTTIENGKEVLHALQGNYMALVILYTAGAGGGYYISKGFFDTISKNIDEAAMIDGANQAQIFWQVVLPLAKPIIVYTVLTSFMGPWGDYMTSSYIIGLENKENWTVAIGLQKWATDTKDLQPIYYTQFAAGAVCVAIPITVLFMFLQKYYVSGVTGGAVKG
jgi:arabinogalactan oligomer/maltooligosaccharide transport system permease protein